MCVCDRERVPLFEPLKQETVKKKPLKFFSFDSLNYRKPLESKTAFLRWPCAAVQASETNELCHTVWHLFFPPLLSSIPALHLSFLFEANASL